MVTSKPILEALRDGGSDCQAFRQDPLPRIWARDWGKTIDQLDVLIGGETIAEAEAHARCFAAAIEKGGQVKLRHRLMRSINLLEKELGKFGNLHDTSGPRNEKDVELVQQEIEKRRALMVDPPLAFKAEVLTK